jgi:hypothetical protein
VPVRPTKRKSVALSRSQTNINDLTPYCFQYYNASSIHRKEIRATTIIWPDLGSAGFPVKGRKLRLQRINSHHSALQLKSHSNSVAWPTLAKYHKRVRDVATFKRSREMQKREGYTAPIFRYLPPHICHVSRYISSGNPLYGAGLQPSFPFKQEHPPILYNLRITVTFL